MKHPWLLLTASLLMPQLCLAVEYPAAPLVSDMPSSVRAWFRNPDGSCVQCSISMCGIAQDCPQAHTLLWDTSYGDKVRGGSGPSRVARYARERNIPVYNITGEGTYTWMKWAIKTGRPCAIGFKRSHFCTLLGHDSASGTWYVCDNNSPTRVDVYSDSEFRRLHESSGRWIVIIKEPPTPISPRDPWVIRSTRKRK